MRRAPSRLSRRRRTHPLHGHGHLVARELRASEFPQLLVNVRAGPAPQLRERQPTRTAAGKECPERLRTHVSVGDVAGDPLAAYGIGYGCAERGKRTLVTSGGHVTKCRSRDVS